MRDVLKRKFERRLRVKERESGRDKERRKKETKRQVKNKEEGPYYVFVSRKKTESKNKSLVGHHLSFDIPVHHECQVFGEGDESTNSKNFWSECRKNPGHPNLCQS